VSATAVARSMVSLVLPVLGIVLLVVALLDLLEGFGVVYCLVLVLLGVIFLVLSGRF
jgi:hypothetical protein